MTRVAFLGLGAMGAPSPREAAAAADVVCTMLSDPAAVEAVANGADGLDMGRAFTDGQPTESRSRA